MESRKLGSQGLQVSALGFGCMGLSGTYGGDTSASDSHKLIHRAIELGYTLFDTAALYGPFTNEELVGASLEGKRDRVIISTKFGFRVRDGRIDGTDSSPEEIVSSVEGSLKRLKTDRIDILFQHRVDPNVPIEEVVGEMAKLVTAGKVRYIGLSEPSASTIRRAHAVHPLSVVQSEYSLLERNLEERVIPVLDELGIGLMPFSPLGRGLVAGFSTAAEQLPKNDYRRLDPRYQGENYARNQHLIEQLAGLAERNGLTKGQMALAWLLNRRSEIAPIVGTTRLTALEENAAATNVRLSTEQIKELESIFATDAVSGERYPPSMMRFLDQE